MLRNNRLFVLLLVSALILAACNLPQAKQDDPEAVMSLAAQTLEARLTSDFLLTPSATWTSQPSATPPASTATFTPEASPTPTSICDMAQYVTDVTIPDGSQFQPNQDFTKTWRLKNTGVCTWTSGYQVIFDNGDAMSGPATQALSGTVAPGQTVDLSVNLKAPAAAGSYRGYWKLRNPAGVILPVISGFQGNSFFVDIKTVPPAPTATATPLVLATLNPFPIIPLPLKTATPTPKILFPIIIVTLGP